MIPVVQVTVSEDRAVVVRRGTIKLAAGTNHITIEDVAPVLVDKSVRASIEKGEAKPGEARVHRAMRVVIPDGERTSTQQLDAEIDEAGDRVAKIQSTLKRIETEIALLHKAAHATLVEISQDAAFGKSPDAMLARSYDTREKELRAEHVRVRWELKDAEAHRTRLRTRRQAMDHPSTRRHASIDVVVSANVAGEATLVVEYVVPGACWRPQHTAILGAKTVSIETDACVWQCTGEDWSNVDLRLSTERPSLGKEPPELSDDTLYVQKRQEVIHVETREQRIETTGVATVRDERVPGIDDGGEARMLVARGKATVPTDGRPHRFPIGTFETSAKVELVCMPQLANGVVVRSEQQNTSKDPLLAGPVDLVREGGFVGRTKIPFIAPGESFELGWGQDPGIRVKHEREEVEEEAGMLSGWIVRHVRERVLVSSLDPSKRRFFVRMRMPVSEIEKVQIALDEASNKAQMDEDGFLQWDVALEGNARRELELAWTIKRHKDVVGI